MALRQQDKVSEREMTDLVVKKLNYLENNKLSENIAVKGDHGAFVDGEILPKGTRVHDIIVGILDSSYEKPYTSPMLELSGIDKNIEVGTVLSSVTLIPVFTKNDTGGLSRFKLERAVGNKGYTTLYDGNNITNYTESNLTVNDTDVIVTYRATAWFNEGATKVVNGEKVEGHIEAGSITTVLEVSGIRKSFYGAENNKGSIAANSTQIRALPLSTDFQVAEGDKIKLEIPVGTNRITFAYPAYLRDIKSIRSELLGYDIKGVFEYTYASVKGNNGYADITYKVYTYMPDVNYPTSDIYTFEI